MRSLVHELAGERLRLADESSLLLLLSTLDLLMTYALMRLRHIRFTESNPLAYWWYARWNIAGLTIFKFLLVAVAIALSEIVERRRPGLGRRILRLGSLAVGVVLGYSIYLMVVHALPDLF